MKRDMAACPDVDPITLEIIRAAMSSTIREMELLSATDDERGRRAAPLALIDRGPGFAEADALWQAGAAPHRETPTGRS